MKASLYLWRQWSAQVRQLLPDVQGHRTKSLAFFVFGLGLSGKARLPLVAEELLRISPATPPASNAGCNAFCPMSRSRLFPSGPVS